MGSASRVRSVSRVAGALRSLGAIVGLIVAAAFAPGVGFAGDSDAAPAAHFGPKKTIAVSKFDATGDLVYVNAGSNANLRVGDQLKLFRITDQVVDPVTQEVLGQEEAQVGTARIVEVQPRYSKADYSGSHPAEVGDTLRYAP